MIRKEFLAKHDLETEADQIKNVLSLLLPKFIKDQIDHGNIFNRLIILFIILIKKLINY